MLIRLSATLRRVPNWIVTTASLLYLAFVAWVDYRTAFGIEMAVFYLPPIAAMAWYLGRGPGIAVAGLATVIEAALESFAGFPDHLLIWNSAAHFLFFFFAAALVAVLAEQTVQLRIMAREDPLTGIPNRRAFFGALDRAVEWSRRQGMAWVLAYLDVDNFKRVNDSLGHAAGDAVLRRVARTLRDCTRRIDVVARLGGDEFALLLPETGPEEAETVVNKLLMELDRAMLRDGWEVTFSVGVITFVTPPDSVDTAVSMADACMYRVKARGKAGAVFRIWPEDAALELPRGVAAAARIGRS